MTTTHPNDIRVVYLANETNPSLAKPPLSWVSFPRISENKVRVCGNRKYRVFNSMWTFPMRNMRKADCSDIGNRWRTFHMNCCKPTILSLIHFRSFISSTATNFYRGAYELYMFYWHCYTYQAPLLLTWINFNPSMDCNVWDEITYAFPNFNGVWEWMSNFIPHFAGNVITYPCWV